MAQTGRQEKDLSQQNWKLWLDTLATWEQDSLYTPPVDINKLPVHEPTGGWSALEKATGRTVHLPATVKNITGAVMAIHFGLAGNYVGVSWFTTNIAVSSAMRNKRIVLKFESVRFRAEVFVNRKLCGYDVIAGTPFEVDITSAVKPGANNEIAIRITDPNGNFDWRDSQNFMWGVYRTQPSHGFGGITGSVKMVATDKVYIDDIFIKNKPSIDEIDLQVTINNTGITTANGSYYIEINEAAGEKRMVYEQIMEDQRLAPGVYTENFYHGDSL